MLDICQVILCLHDLWHFSRNQSHIFCTNRSREELQKCKLHKYSKVLRTLFPQGHFAKILCYVRGIYSCVPMICAISHITRGIFFVWVALINIYKTSKKKTLKRHTSLFFFQVAYSGGISVNGYYMNICRLNIGSII